MPATWEEAVETLTRLLVLLASERRLVEGLERSHRLVEVEHLGAKGDHRVVQPGVHNVVTEGGAAETESLLEHQYSPPAGLHRFPHLEAEYFDLDTLRGTSEAKGPREQLWPSRLAEVDAEEARLAAKLRAEQEAS